MKVKFNIFVFILLSVALLTGNVEASTKNKQSPFSIAISGGASKGAYEAGLNWSAIKILMTRRSFRHGRRAVFPP